MYANDHNEYDAEIECLDTVVCMFDTCNTQDNIEMELASPVTNGYAGTTDWDAVSDAALTVLSAAPAGIFRTKVQQDRALRTGIIDIGRRDTTADVHSRLAAFRLFIELEGTIEMFNQHKDIDVMGSFINAHMVCLTASGYQMDAGWHQSMFSSMSHRPQGLLETGAIRRIAALDPRTRCLLHEPGQMIEDRYYISELRDDVCTEAIDLIANSDLRAELGDAGDDFAKRTKVYAAWYQMLNLFFLSRVPS